MSFSKTVAGACVALLGVGVFLLRPYPISCVLEASPVLFVGFYLVIGFVTWYLLLYRRPLQFVDPSGKAVLITGEFSGTPAC